MGAWSSRLACIGTLALAVAALGGCAGSGVFGARQPEYSRKLVEDGEAVPKGGGTWKVGQPYRVKGRSYVPSENRSYRAEGIASWYGPDFHGRETANGEVYDMHSITAAHPTLPMPSYARVTNLANNRSIIVRVNDRGPYAHNRLIDVSIGAAKQLDFYKKGLARVRVEYVGRAPIEGSDDRMLVATLREGSPAPAPVRVAATTRGRVGAGPRGGEGPLSTNPFALGPDDPAARRTETAGDANARSAPLGPALQTGGSPVTGYAPSGSLGFMSGRGLY